MQYRIGFFCLLALAVVAFSGCGGGGGGVGVSTAAAVGAGPATGDLSIASSADPAPATRSIRLAAFGPLGSDPNATAERFECYTGHQHEAPYMRAVRSKHSKSLVLMYEIAAAAADADWAKYDGYINDPIGYYWIRDNHPEWILKDTKGDLMRFNGDSYLVAMDPGNPEYQKAWASKAVERLRATGADGIMIDNTNTRWDWIYVTTPQKYPDNQSWAEAMDSFLRYVSQEIKAAGFLVVVNGSAEPWNSGYWASWMPLLDGRVYEPGGGPDEPTFEGLRESYQQWPDKIAIHYLPSEKLYPERIKWAIACFLLWQERNSYLGLRYNTDPEPFYDPLMDVRIGDPVGQCEQVTDMTYRRTYQHGEVFVNGSSTRSAAIQVAGGGKDTDGTPIPEGTKTLGPRGWLIVVR